ncbi:MAG: tRNA lysidine(34) synthetase TilS C-terminal domain-containing protein, partial [Planctomycetota bacterium]
RLDLRQRQLETLLASTLRHHPGAEAVEVARDVLLPLPETFLDLALRRMGTPLGAERDGPFFTRRHLRRLRDLLASGGALDLPRGLVVTVAGNHVLLARRTRTARCPRPVLERQDLPSEAFDLDAFLSRRPLDGAALDADRLGRDARFRPLRTGDRFLPFGTVPAHPVEIDAWLARRGVPRRIRRGLWVLEGAHDIAWVPGYRIDRSHAVTPETKRVAHVRIRWRRHVVHDPTETQAG